MKNSPLLLLAFLFLISSGMELSAQGNLQKEGLQLSGLDVSELDGAYRVSTIGENGKTEQFNVKFKNGQLISVAINGNEIPEADWKEHEEVIREYLTYISPKETKKYKYEQVYDFEEVIKRDLKKLEAKIEDLEIERQLEDFYYSELKGWIASFEKELQESELVDELDDVLDEMMNELDKFVSERKKYKRELEKKK